LALPMQQGQQEEQDQEPQELPMHLEPQVLLAPLVWLEVLALPMQQEQQVQSDLQIRPLPVLLRAPAEQKAEMGWLR
jgi:hypothetical protein